MKIKTAAQRRKGSETDWDKKQARAEKIVNIVALVMLFVFVIVLRQVSIWLQIVVPWWLAFILGLAFMSLVYGILEPLVHKAMGFPTESAPEDIEEWLEAFPAHERPAIANELGESMSVKAGMLVLFTIFLSYGLIKTTGLWFWVFLVAFLACLPFTVMGVTLAKMVTKPYKRFVVADALKSLGVVDLYEMAKEMRR